MATRLRRVRQRHAQRHERNHPPDRHRPQAGCLFTNPVKMQQLARITDAGERMPYKSTYFYPKMYTGLTIQNCECWRTQMTD